VAADVLHVTQPTTAGVSACVDVLVRSQLAAGLHVAVACPASPFGAALADAGADVRPWTATRNPGPSTLGETHRLRALVADLDPRVVYLHSAKAGLAGRLAVRGSRPTVFVPHAWSFHAVGGLLARASLVWERVATRWTSVLVCVSEGEREQGVAAGLRVTWRVIPNGVDLIRFRPSGAKARQSAREALDLDGAPLVVCLGRLSRQKGQDVLLDAWPSVLAAVPEARLALVGDGPERDALLARATPRVELLPGVAEVRPLLAAADVVVAPSRWDGMSLVLLEAMASARCIVATDVPGARDALGAEAELIPPGEAAPLAQALASRLDDESRRDAEAVANRSRAEACFGLERMTDAHRALVAELTGRL
jgi:glycosyltransferase involved in cell wall biosynthesis